MSENAKLENVKSDDRGLFFLSFFSSLLFRARISFRDKNNEIKKKGKEEEEFEKEIECSSISCGVWLLLCAALRSFPYSKRATLTHAALTRTGHPEFTLFLSHLCCRAQQMSEQQLLIDDYTVESCRVSRALSAAAAAVDHFSLYLNAGSLSFRNERRV